MKLAEGYGIVVLERADATPHARGATPLAHVLGCGESADAHHLTQPHPQGDGAARAMPRGARVAPASTPADIGLDRRPRHRHARQRRRRIRRACPASSANDLPTHPRRRLQESPRPHARRRRRGRVDPRHDGDARATRAALCQRPAGRRRIPRPCPQHRRCQTRRIRATLNTSLGFGGANTCVVLGRSARTTFAAASPRRVEAEERPRRPHHRHRRRPPRRDRQRAFLARLARPRRPMPGTHDTGPIPEEHIVHLLNARRVRRMSDHVKLTLAATAVAVQRRRHRRHPRLRRRMLRAILGSAARLGQLQRRLLRRDRQAGHRRREPDALRRRRAQRRRGPPESHARRRRAPARRSSARAPPASTRCASPPCASPAASGTAPSSARPKNTADVINDAYRHCGLYAGSGGAAPFAAEGHGFVTGAAAVTFILESRDAAQSRGRHAATAWSSMAPPPAPIHGDPSAAARQVLTAAPVPAPRHQLRQRHPDRPRRARRAPPTPAAGATVSSIYGHVAESFSVTRSSPSPPPSSPAASRPPRRWPSIQPPAHPRHRHTKFPTPSSPSAPTTQVMSAPCASACSRPRKTCEVSRIE